MEKWAWLIALVVTLTVIVPIVVVSRRVALGIILGVPTWMIGWLAVLVGARLFREDTRPPKGRD